jgi:hypothetical protein
LRTLEAQPLQSSSRRRQFYGNGVKVVASSVDLIAWIHKPENPKVICLLYLLFLMDAALNAFNFKILVKDKHVAEMASSVTVLKIELSLWVRDVKLKDSN